MKYLYKIPLDEARQTNEGGSLESQLAQAGLLEGDGTVVNQLTNSAADLSLEGQFKPPQWHAEMHAEELEELANSSLEALPLFRSGKRYAEAGYYEISSADVGPAHANARAVAEWSLSLTKKGTRNTHYRVIEANPRGPGSPNGVDHEFGNALEATTGLPTSARKVQWYNDETGEREPASPAETRDTEFGEIDIYDLDDASWYEVTDDADEEVPLLIYEADYADEAPQDCAVYDTLGADQKYIANDDGRVRIWESVFDTGHDFDHEIVFDNSLIRLRLDESNGTLEAEEWDASSDSWTSVGLSQPSTVELFDVDLQSVQMVRDQAQLTFDADGELFALDAIVHAGWDVVQFDIPSGEPDPIPMELEDWLRPIASESVIDPNASKTLVARDDVRR